MTLDARTGADARIGGFGRAAGALLLAALATAVGAQTPAPASEPNAALRYWMAFAQMQNPEASDISAELARVEAGEIPFDEARHGPVLDANVDALATMLRASRLAECDWALETELGPRTPIAHVARARALARLNTLAGMRLAARGDVRGATDRWIAGIRFSQHLAAGGSLLATLVGTTALRSTLGAVERAASAGTLSAASSAGIRDALENIPVTGFNWDSAWRAERAATEIWIATLGADPAAFERETGRAGSSAPNPDQVAAYRAFMERVAQALALPPDEARSALLALEPERTALHPFLDGLIPSPQRTNDTRTAIQEARDRVLALL